MNLFFVAISVAVLFVDAGQAARQPGRPETEPPGWSETRRKAMDLTLEGKDREVLAMYEQWVAKHPNFADGHFMLGAAHESVARALITSRAADAQATRIKHFEAAAVHMRRGLELAGPEASFFMMRSLIDLHGPIGLNRPAEYEKLVREGVTRYPAEPHAHAYLLALLATKGEPIDSAARAARAAIPKGADARVDLAGALVAHVADFGRLTPTLAPALLPEALRLIDEALKLKPNDAAALRVQGDIRAAMQLTSSQLPPADEVGVRGILRAIVSAQITYFAVCGNGFYAPTLAILARPEPGKTLGFLGADLVPAGGSTVLEKSRYRIEMSAAPSPKSTASCNGVPAGGSAGTFSVVARPLKGFVGRAFRIDADGNLTEIK